jgi:hypothetical protein
MVTTFTLFSQLPHKLRSKIWHHALPLFSRIIELRHVRSKDELHNHASPRWIVFPTSKPTLLSINQESRQILLPHYSSPFQSLRICPHLGIQSLLINYDVDTLFINIESRWPGHLDVLFRDLVGSRFDEVQGNLKKLAGTEYFWATMLEEARQRRMKGNRREFLSEFVGLEEAVVVAERLSPELPLSRRLVRFEELTEESEDWRRLEEYLYPFFSPFRKKRYLERLCVAVETPSDFWKLGMK